MSIRKAPDSRYPDRPWLVEVYRDGERTRRRAKTRREALQVEREIQTAPSIDPRGPEHALLEYVTSLVPALKRPSDQLSHARIIRPYIAGRTWADYPKIILELSSAHREAGLSVATLNRRLALLRRIAKLAQEWGWIPVAPRVKLRAESGREVFLTPTQVEALAAQMPRAGAMFLLCCYTGLRRTEALSLTQEDIRDGGLTVATLKQKRRTLRWVPVPGKVRHLLDTIPFPLTKQIIRREWEKARNAAGMPGVRWHDARHTYASFLAASGATDRELSLLLGHSSPHMIARYAHLRSDHLKGVVDKI